MSIGRVLLSGLLALVLALGASSTATAQSGYMNGLSTGAVWGIYPGISSSHHTGPVKYTYPTPFPVPSARPVGISH